MPNRSVTRLNVSPMMTRYETHEPKKKRSDAQSTSGAIAPPARRQSPMYECSRVVRHARSRKASDALLSAKNADEQQAADEPAAARERERHGEQPGPRRRVEQVERRAHERERRRVRRLEAHVLQPDAEVDLGELRCGQVREVPAFLQLRGGEALGLGEPGRGDVLAVGELRGREVLALGQPRSREQPALLEPRTAALGERARRVEVRRREVGRQVATRVLEHREFAPARSGCAAAEPVVGARGATRSPA